MGWGPGNEASRVAVQGAKPPRNSAILDQSTKLFLKDGTILVINPPTFGAFFIQVDAPFETIRYCGLDLSKW